MGKLVAGYHPSLVDGGPFPNDPLGSDTNAFGLGLHSAYMVALDKTGLSETVLAWGSFD
jgi:hypothetical protein